MKKFKFFLKSILFLCLLAFVMQRVSWALIVTGTKDDSTDRRTSLFYALPHDTVDVAFGGTSHIYCTLCPQQIYDETGITSASFATSSQSIENTYWMLKEAYMRQHIKVFVMDLSAMSAGVSSKVQNFRLHYTSGITNIPDLSINKLLDYKEIKERSLGWSKEMTIYDAWGILEFKNDHDRGDASFMNVLSILCNPAKEFKTFGFMATDTVYPIDKLSSPVSQDYCDLKETTEFVYLQKILALCEKHGSKLVIVQAPFQYQSDNCGLYDQTKEWATEHDVAVVDYFELLDQLGIDTSTDMRDEDHLNYLGAKKATTYFSSYLKDNYQLPDHRGDKKYSLWEERNFDYQAVEDTLMQEISLNFDE